MFMDRVILHVDLDYFFAQCEELRKPEIRGKPVVVCIYSGRTETSGAVSTSNYKARELGIRSGIAIYQAKRLAEGKDVVFLSADRDYYWAISEKIMELLRGHGDRFEQVSVDEAFLDVTQRTKGSFDHAKEMAYGIKREILEKERLTCSVGVGPNKLIAKMAASVKKPDGLTLITPSMVREFLSPLPVKKLFGVGPKTEEKLKALGIATIGTLASFDVTRLRDVFREKSGVYLHEASNGIDDEPVEESERKQISRIMTLKENTVEFGKISAEIGPLAEDIAKELETEGKSFRTIGIMAVMEDLSPKTRARTIDSTDSAETIKRVAEELLAEFLKEADKKIRRFGVSVSGLEEKKSQKDLQSFFK